MDIERIRFQAVQDNELENVLKLETDGYPADEAASLDSLSLRQNLASGLFIGAYIDDTLLGFVCSTRYGGDKYCGESLSDHQPNGKNVCLHSVCVAKEHQRKGIALRLLKHYIDHVTRTETGVARIALICKAQLIPLYTRAGFTLVAASDVVHGKDKWYEMELKLV